MALDDGIGKVLTGMAIGSMLNDNSELRQRTEELQKQAQENSELLRKNQQYERERRSEEDYNRRRRETASMDMESKLDFLIEKVNKLSERVECLFDIIWREKIRNDYFVSNRIHFDNRMGEDVGRAISLLYQIANKTGINKVNYSWMKNFLDKNQEQSDDPLHCFTAFPKIEKSQIVFNDKEIAKTFSIEEDFDTCPMFDRDKEIQKRYHMIENEDESITEEQEIKNYLALIQDYDSHHLKQMKSWNIKSFTEEWKNNHKNTSKSQQELDELYSEDLESWDAKWDIQNDPHDSFFVQ